MSSKGGGTQGYRYYMALFSGLCRGPIDEVVEIQAGDRTAWTGQANGLGPYQIASPNLFGGDDKEGGVEGPFRVYQGGPTQVLDEDVKASIGGRVPGFRGIASVWFDGLVAAMNPYLKTWKFRVRRTTAGWHENRVWRKSLCRIPMGNGLGDSGVFPVSTNRAARYAIVSGKGVVTITFRSNSIQDDTITINGRTLTFVADQKDKNLDYNEVDPDKNLNRTVQKTAAKINASASAFKVTASANGAVLTLSYITGQAAAEIVGMNPAHILFQCHTDPLWGRGYPWEMLDDASWSIAAQTLFNEGFGLAIGWYRKETIEEFMQRVADLISAVIYTDRETGLIAIKLIRNDYDPEDLPVFSFATGLLAITDDDSASSDNSFNEIVGTSRDPITNLDFQVRAQNLAGLQSQGAPSTEDRDYRGIPTRDLLARVTLRDMRTMAVGLKKYSLSVDRSAWWITPGSVIRVNEPSRGLQNVVLRVAEIDDGTMLKGEIKLKAAIDVFGLPETAFIEPVQNGWIGPATVAAPPLDQDTIEASYRDLYQEYGVDFVQRLDPGTTYIGTVATAPNATSLQYDLLTSAEGDAEYREVGRADFTGRVALVDAVGTADTVWTIAKPVQFTQENVGQVLRAESELVRLDEWNETTGVATVTRGVVDTVPAPHEAGITLFTIDDDLKIDDREYTIGETVTALVLTRTSQERLSPADALPMSRTLTGRHARPYPPADVQVDGQRFFEVTGLHREPVITWSTRNRITQADVAVGYFAPSVAPEEGQTVTIRVKSLDGSTLFAEYKGIEGTTWTYTAAMRENDKATPKVLLEIESERAGLTSRAVQSFVVAIQGGWGYAWGKAWGG